MTLTSTLLAAALLSAAPADRAPADRAPDAAPEVVPPSAEERDYSEPPEGAPADRELWRALRDATSVATVSLGRISQCAFRIRYDKYYEALDAAAAQGTPEQATVVKALRKRLEDEASAADAVVPRGPRPSIRGCRYTLLFLEQRMTEPAGSQLAAELPKSRAEAARCLEDMRGLAGAARPRAEALEATLAAIDTSLGRAPRLPSPTDAARLVEGADPKESR
jgi:hypothetical protein